MVQSDEGTTALTLELCREFEDKFMQHITTGEDFNSGEKNSIGSQSNDISSSHEGGGGVLGGFDASEGKELGTYDIRSCPHAHILASSCPR
ncbi:dynamin GTPase, partial [Sarracenia purpurea var. burkii]